MNEFISFQNFSFRYYLRKEWSLKSVDLNIKKGELTILTGPSGSGKTSVCYSINGLIPHFYAGEVKGSVFIAEKNVSKSPVSELSRKIGYIPQRAENSFVTPYVFSELAFPLEYRSFSKESIKNKILELANYLDLTKLLKRNPNELSEGEKQKLAIGCALVTEPEIIIADEPLANLDYSNQQKIITIFKSLQQKGKTIIIATHEYFKYKELNPRFIQIEKGQITGNLIENGEESKREFEIVKKKLYLKDIKSEKESEVSKSEIEVKNLSFKFSNGFSISDINFTTNRGKIIGLVGDNGSGKTTLFRLLCGFLKPDSGSIKLSGKDLKDWNWSELAAYLGVIFQDPDKQFFEEEIGKEVGFISKNLDLNFIDTKKIENELSSCHLENYVFYNPHSLSHGEKRRLAFVSSTFHNPELILIDEVTNGLDRENKEWVSNQILKLKQENKMLIIVSHDWHWLSKFVDEIIYLKNGRIEQVLNRDQFSSVLQKATKGETILLER